MSLPFKRYVDRFAALYGCELDCDAFLKMADDASAHGAKNDLAVQGRAHAQFYGRAGYGKIEDAARILPSIGHR